VAASLIAKHTLHGNDRGQRSNGLHGSVEINPILDEHNRTALLGVELVLSASTKNPVSAWQKV